MVKKCKKGYQKKGDKCVKKKSASSTFKAKNYTWIIYVVLGVLALGIFVYGGTHDWFKGSPLSISNTEINNFLNQQDDPANPSLCTLELNPNSIFSGDRVTGNIYNGKNTHCWVIANDGSGWVIVYEGDTNENGFLTDTRNIDPIGNFVFRALCDANHNGGMDTGDCLTNKEDLVVLARPSDCSDSDGRDRYSPGWVIADGTTYYDKCLDVGSAVTEYTCVDGSVFSENLACDYGEECISTRSGGYCQDIDTSWSPGDIVWSGSNSGSIQFASGVNLAVITPGELGFEAGGPCHLEVILQTDWNYVGGESACSVQELNGVFYQQHLKWDFFDSAGLRYSRVDPYPRGVSETIYPVNFDGINNWKLQITTLDNVQGCTINYDWSMTVKVAECD